MDCDTTNKLVWTTGQNGVVLKRVEVGNWMVVSPLLMAPRSCSPLF